VHEAKSIDDGVTRNVNTLLNTLPRLDSAPGPREGFAATIKKGRS
jgi:predicted transcriptional regulator